jgi:hypothetical protein
MKGKEKNWQELKSWPMRGQKRPTCTTKNYGIAAFTSTRKKMKTGI